MKKVSINGLLTLKPDEIKIIYLRCRGETVENTAKKLHYGASTVYKITKEVICPALDVEEWGEIEDELCKPLLEMVHSLEDLNNWPEGFREKIEALGVTPQPQKEPQSNTEIDKSKLPPWILFAIPILVLCVLCISGVLFVRSFIPFFQATPTLPTPTNTLTAQPTNTKLVVFTQTSLPTLTDTPIPPTSTVTFTPTETPTMTNTPLPTETPTPAVEPLFFDDFTDGKSDIWQTIYGEPIIVDNALSFQATTLMVIDANDWTDYEVSFDVSNMGCQGGVSSRGVTIGQRYQNANNMVALRLFHWSDNCNASWYLIKDGDWNKIKNASFPLPPKDSNGMRHFILSVEGNTYNSPFGVSLVIEEFQSGGVALMADKGVIIDNFRITPLDSQE